MPFWGGFFLSLLLWGGLEIAFGAKTKSDAVLIAWLGGIAAVFFSAFVALAVSGWVQLRSRNNEMIVDSNKAFIVGLAALIFMSIVTHGLMFVGITVPKLTDFVPLLLLLVWPILMGECIMLWSAKSAHRRIKQ